MHWRYCSLALSHWNHNKCLGSRTLKLKTHKKTNVEQWVVPNGRQLDNNKTWDNGYPKKLNIQATAVYWTRPIFTDTGCLSMIGPHQDVKCHNYHCFLAQWNIYIYIYIWLRSRNCGCLVTWFCYQLIAKPGNKTAAVSWPDLYIYIYIYRHTHIYKWITSQLPRIMRQVHIFFLFVPDFFHPYLYEINEAFSF